MATTPPDQLQLVLRVLVACVLAALQGYEREEAHKFAGLRTHILVGVAAATFVMLTEVVAGRYAGGGPAFGLDPSRAVQAVAMGVGFLGGGVIFVSRDQVYGLTTAASVWTVAAVGAACGFGEFGLAGALTLIALVTLHVLVRFDSGQKEG